MHIRHVCNNLPYYNILINVYAIVLLLAHSATSLSCYVCGLEDNLSDCDNFNPSNENSYTKECPPESQGCSVQTKGSTIINMACDNYKVDDCKTANGIEYCYCSSDMCNGNKSIKKSITTSSIDPNDDEDMIEGSGYSTIFPTTRSTTPVLQVQTTVQPLNTGDCLHSTFIVIAASILLP